VLTNKGGVQGEAGVRAILHLAVWVYLQHLAAAIGAQVVFVEVDFHTKSLGNSCLVGGT